MATPQQLDPGGGASGKDAKRPSTSLSLFALRAGARSPGSHTSAEQLWDHRSKVSSVFQRWRGRMGWGSWAGPGELRLGELTPCTLQIRGRALHRITRTSQSSAVRWPAQSGALSRRLLRPFPLFLPLPHTLRPTVTHAPLHLSPPGFHRIAIKIITAAPTDDRETAGSCMRDDGMDWRSSGN